MVIHCLECGSPLDKENLESNGIVHCPVCSHRFVQEEALTYVAEIPDTEYLGG